ncbi:MAG: apolipoprotein N-acyltransferase [Gammaproteobacteria bacterium]|nr:apolipoprotein N-acyltransferase [Gammaproteobacteria bacterium]
MGSSWFNSRFIHLLAAFIAGALTVLAFAPFSLYLLALPGVLLLAYLWQSATPRQAFFQGWCYGAGLLGFGVFWLHNSIDQFGNLGTALAIFITLSFVAALAIFYGAAGWLVCRLVQNRKALLLFVPIWVLLEWFRGWALTGFPWLSLGYSQIDSPLAGWAALLGVFGISALLVLSAVLILLLPRPGAANRLVVVSALGVIWGGGWLLGHHDWTKVAGEPLKVAMIQANIPQQNKWRPEYLQPTLAYYARLTRQQWQRDIIIWPETAVPAYQDRIWDSFLKPLSDQASETGTSLVTGIPVWDQSRGHFFNAIITLGSEQDSYHKRHLVPFGEYMPFKWLLSPLINWLQIPMSDFTPGSASQPLMRVAGYQAGVSICYEDAFGEEMIESLPEAAFLINISNDAWFGDSLALPQHLEMARMRALEGGRYMLRATNNGVSAIIDHKGRVLIQSPSFEPDLLVGEIKPMEGLTPYARLGNWAVISLALLSLLLIGWFGRGEK